MESDFRSSGTPLSQESFDTAVGQTGGDHAALWALLAVETRGFGFFADRRPKILFERHIFHKRTGGRFSTRYPDISSADSGGYRNGVAEYERLSQALKLDRRAALESASWGLGQVMGFNAVTLGYSDVEEMVTQFICGENEQLDGAVRFLVQNPALLHAFRTRNWARVAFFYNGKSFAKNQYDVKLAESYLLYAAGHVPSIRIRTAQAQLTYLGINPRGIDGVLGHGTRTALMAFQQMASIPPTAELDAATEMALKTAMTP